MPALVIPLHLRLLADPAASDKTVPVNAFCVMPSQLQLLLIYRY